MTKLRILHIADAHLDTPFYGHDKQLRRRLRDSCRNAFQLAVDEAINRDVHAVLIAGDLFDNDQLSFHTERFILDQMERLGEENIAVYYATGNHDPGRANYRAHQLGWPKNVHLFTSTTPTTVVITDRDDQPVAKLTAAGHNSVAEASNLAANFQPSDTNLPSIGLLHTQVLSASGAANHDRYAPCSEHDLRAPGFDYWALGHVHLRQQVSEDIPAWYAGNIQGSNPNETGQKGVLYVEIEHGSLPAVEFIPVAPLIWENLNIVCREDVDDLRTLTAFLETEIRSRLTLSDGKEHLLRLELTGQTPLADEIVEEENLEELTQSVKNATDLLWLEMRPHILVLPVDIESYQDRPTVLGEVLHLLDEAKEDNGILQQLSPDPLAQNSEDNLAYLRSLLDGADIHAASLLVDKDNR